jgi:hypothetical protein
MWPVCRSQIPSSPPFSASKPFKNALPLSSTDAVSSKLWRGAKKTAAANVKLSVPDDAAAAYEALRPYLINPADQYAVTRGPAVLLRQGMLAWAALQGRHLLFRCRPVLPAECRFLRKLLSFCFPRALRLFSRTRNHPGSWMCSNFHWPVAKFWPPRPTRISSIEECEEWPSAS